MGYNLKTMRKIYLQVLILVIIIPISLAHDSLSEHVHNDKGYAATLICTEHRNELAARGLGPIFMHKNKYCVAFADSSQQILEEFADWIYASIFEVFTGTVANNSAINHNKDRQDTVFLDEFIDWVTGENFSGDEDRYPGPGNFEETSNTIKDVPAEDSGNASKIPIAQ